MGQLDFAIFDFDEVTESFHVLDNFRAAFVPVQALIFLATVLVDRRVRVENVDLFQAVAQTAGVVVVVVRRRHFHAAGPEFLLRQQSVGDDRNVSTGHRNATFQPNKMLVPLVRRMNTDRRVANHRFRSRRRKRQLLAGQLAIFAHNRISERPEVAVNFLVKDFVVGNCRLQMRIPVDQSLATENQPVFEEPKECPTHGLRAGLVQREPSPSPVAARAKLPKLFKNPLLVRVLPLPDPLDERLAPDVVPREAFLFKHPPLNDRLSGNPRVVGAWHPQSFITLHPPPASDQILQRAIQRVPHVQRTGHVRQRNHDRMRLLLRIRIRIGIEVAILFPVIEPPTLDFRRLVLLWKFCAHDSVMLRNRLKLSETDLEPELSTADFRRGH